MIYISGRSFVLRDASEPTKPLSLSDRAENLEGIESRLKEDILAEAAKLRTVYVSRSCRSRMHDLDTESCPLGLGDWF